MWYIVQLRRTAYVSLHIVLSVNKKESGPNNTNKRLDVEEDRFYYEDEFIKKNQVAELGVCGTLILQYVVSCAL